MLGLMSDQQLLISSLIEHSGKYHGQTEIVDCDTEGKIYKTNYSDTLIRVKKLANSLKNLNVNLGDTIDVKYFGVDPRTRKDKVSRKALLPKPEGYVDKPRKTFNRNNNRKGFNKK